MIFAPLIGKSLHHTLVFYRNPKCASSTIAYTLRDRNLLWRERKTLQAALQKDPKYRGLFDVTHCLPLEARKIFGRGLENFFSFACVRNPYDKQVSQFEFSRKKGWGLLYGVDDNGSFSDWCELLWKKRNDQTFWPTIPQTVFTHSLRLNHILRFENLQNDWRKMISTNQIPGLPLELPHENKTHHRPWQEYYTERCAEIVGDIFFRDFDLLSYQTGVL